jgi:hypothetical protein
MFFAAFIGAGVSGVVALMTWLAVAAASLARGIGSAGSGF